MTAYHLTKYFHFFVLGILAMRYKAQYEKIMKSEFFKAFVLLAFLLYCSCWIILYGQSLFFILCATLYFDI